MNSMLEGYFIFLSTPSARRATEVGPLLSACPDNFYPRPPRGGRHILVASNFHMYIFLSTPSARRATVRRFEPCKRHQNFYPRPPRGGRPGMRRCPVRHPGNFYPRPPRGGRPLLVGIPPTVRIISIHALREEGDVLW